MAVDGATVNAAFLDELRAAGHAPRADALAARVAFADALVGVCAAAAAAWPDVALGPEAFARHLARHAGADPEGYLAAVHAEDLYLACACSAHDAAAIRALEARHLARVPAALARLRATPDRADEVAQRLRERFLVGARAIADYSGRGPLAAWVRVAAVRTLLSMLRHDGVEAAVGVEALLDVPAASS